VDCLNSKCTVYLLIERLLELLHNTDMQMTKHWTKRVKIIIISPICTNSRS
jgi:hypothetical protein